MQLEANSGEQHVHAMGRLRTNDSPDCTLQGCVETQTGLCHRLLFLAKEKDCVKQACT